LIEQLKYKLEFEVDIFSISLFGIIVFTQKIFLSREIYGKKNEWKPEKSPLKHSKQASPEEIFVHRIKET